jgi:hypothetical protein
VAAPSPSLAKARADSWFSSFSHSQFYWSVSSCRWSKLESKLPKVRERLSAGDESLLQPCSRRAHLLLSFPSSLCSQIAPTSSNRRPRPTRILLISDPQLIHFQSPSFQRKPWKTAITEFVVDTFLKKSWSVAKQFKPDAVFFLGDQLDSGRATMSDAE